MLLESHAIIARGEKVLLVGASGTGKTTLVRAVAGLWPWGAGRVLVPAGARTAFLPQRPYMPVGTLRQALQYPDNAESHDDASLRTALVRCGLRRLIPRLDEATAWDKLLSGGELQRIGFARLLVRRPDIVIMDEATSALDTEGQDLMMELFRHELSAATLISVGHRPELEEYHDRKLTLIRRSTGVAMSSSATIRTRDRLATLIPRALRPGTS
jgi:putative ATP-binding cassette transporter